MRTTPNADFFLEVAQGNISGYKNVYKFGRVDGISASDGIVVIWNNGGNLILPDANGTLSIVSASTDDAVGQGGATEITIQGLVDDGSGNWNEQEVVYALTGTTPVVTTEQFIRVNRMFISAGEDRTLFTGTSPTAANHGKITVTHNGTGQPISAISEGQGQTLQAVYTVPSGYNGFPVDADANIGEAADGVFGFYIRNNTVGDEVFRIQGTREAFQTEVSQEFRAIGKIEPKTDIVFTVKTSKVDKNASATFQLLLKEI